MAGKSIVKWYHQLSYMLYPVLRSQVTPCAASRVACSHVKPLLSFQRVLHLPPNYKRLFLDESWTEADVTQLTWELLDQMSGKKVKVYSEEFQKLTKMSLKVKRPPLFRRQKLYCKKKKRNWQLTPKKQPKVHVLQNHKSDMQSVSCIDMLELKHTVVLSFESRCDASEHFFALKSRWLKGGLSRDAPIWQPNILYYYLYYFFISWYSACWLLFGKWYSQIAGVDVYVHNHESLARGLPAISLHGYVSTGR